MKKKIIYGIRIFTLFLAFGLLMIGSGYLYIIKSARPAETHTESIPYEFSMPENKGIMLDINSSLTFLYLDFEDQELKIIFPPEESYSDEVYGYPINHTVKSDLSFVSALIDFAGGIELYDEDELYRYTGIQITDLLSRTPETDELKRSIINALLKKVGETGIDKEVFYYIPQNTDTDITVLDLYGINSYIQKLCLNAVVVN